MKFAASLVNAFTISAVDHENQALSARVVVSPQRTDLILTSNILKMEGK